ncbi:hypothetical protein RFI_27029, partial [Reticulomyxa filosa]
MSTSVLGVNISTPYATWMDDMQKNRALYGGDLYSKTIFDIVWPVAKKKKKKRSGDWLGEIWANTTAFPKSVQRRWSTRHEGDIAYQLKGGSRFLDLRLEYVSSENQYYTHQDQIKDFIEATKTSVKKKKKNTQIKILYEIILVSLTDYLMHGEGDGNDSKRIADLFERIVTALGRYMVTTILFPDLTIVTLQQLRALNLNVICFSDALSDNSTYDQYFFNVNDTFIVHNEFVFQNYTTTRTSVIDQLRLGWDARRFHRIFWTTPIGSMYSLSQQFASFRQYNNPTLQDLFPAIQTYPKLRFANAFLTDYMVGSGVVEQALLLNYNYFHCQDDSRRWGTNTTDCPYLASLDKEYRNDNISSTCGSLERTQCKRSCGLCPYEKGAPGSSCDDDSDCHNPYFDAYLGVGKNGTCYVSTSRQRYYIPEKSFCMSTTMYPTCQSVEQMGCNALEEDWYGNGSNVTCNPCTNNFDCASSYCSSLLYVCTIPNEITFRTPAPTNAKDRYSFVPSTSAK